MDERLKEKAVKRSKNRLDEIPNYTPDDLAPEKKTNIEVLDLIKEWESNPAWELESTPGFEAHHAELWRYRMESEREWKEAKERRRKRSAQSMNLSLQNYDIWKEYKSLSDTHRREAKNLMLNLVYDTVKVDEEHIAIVEHLLDRIIRGATNAAKAEIIADKTLH